MIIPIKEFDIIFNECWVNSCPSDKKVHNIHFGLITVNKNHWARLRMFQYKIPILQEFLGGLTIKD